METLDSDEGHIGLIITMMVLMITVFPLRFSLTTDPVSLPPASLLLFSVISRLFFLNLEL